MVSIRIDAIPIESTKTCFGGQGCKHHGRGNHFEGWVVVGAAQGRQTKMPTPSPKPQ